MEELPHLKIKAEYKNLIRPLRHTEYLQLEENILQDGCLNPIITWNGFIVDGHNRYEICTKHNIPFKTIEKDFASNEEAIIWICANQLGRRNISEETRKFLIGMQYELEKVVITRRNAEGKNQYTESTDDYVIGEEPPKELESRHRTAVRIAKENHISSGTVQKYAIYTRALETIGKKSPEMVPKILSGRYKISHANVVELAQKPPDELAKINRRMNRSNSPFFQYSQSRGALKVQDTPEGFVPSIKEMPSFDPDAEVTELTLTMPSWVSSIKRTQSHANMSIVSENAKEKLISALNTLKETTEELLLSIEEI